MKTSKKNRGAVSIYYTSFNEAWSVERFHIHINLLPVALHADILRYYRWQDRQSHLLGKILLLKGLKDFGYKPSILEQLQWNTFGKPYINNELYFNISHSGKYVICAFSEEASLGIDIEEIKTINLLDFKNFYNDTDWQKIMISKNIYTAFFDIWTKKEAVVKAMGQGLSIPFQDIALAKDMADVKDSVYFIKNLRIDNRYCVALASNMQIKKIILRKLDFG